MGVTLKARLRKMNQIDLFMAVILLWPFSFGALIDMMGMPNAVKYIVDIAWLLLFCLIVINLQMKKLIIPKNIAVFLIWFISFFVFVLIVYLFRYQSVLYFLWGFRNNFRFLIFFAALVLFMKQRDVDTYLKQFDVLFWANAVVCLVQFFVFDKRWDYLGGFFGVEKGCNAHLNVFMVLIIVKSVIGFLNRKETFASFFLKSGVAMVLSALAELKFFFVEYVVVICGAVLIAKFTIRKAVIAVAGLVAVTLGYITLISVFPQFAHFFTIENMIKNATEGGYTYSNAVNRLNAIPIISKQYLVTFIDRAVGLGLGNCETASYDFLNTPFFQNHSFLCYHWFSTAFTYLETGFIGLTFTVGLFVLVFVKAQKKRKQLNISNELSVKCQIAALMAIMCVVIFIYNGSLRTESGYMAYFMLALPFIGEREEFEQ